MFVHAITLNRIIRGCTVDTLRWPLWDSRAEISEMEEDVRKMTVITRHCFLITPLRLVMRVGGFNLWKYGSRRQSRRRQLFGYRYYLLSSCEPCSRGVIGADVTGFVAPDVGSPFGLGGRGSGGERSSKGLFALINTEGGIFLKNIF